MRLVMVGRISECLLLAYSAPEEQVSMLVPEGLELVTQGQRAFWNIVLCRVEAMRPRGVARSLGYSYHHVAYRLYVRARSAQGPAVSGLYFVRSDVDRSLICVVGNRLTDFRFNLAKVTLIGDEDRVTAEVCKTPGGIADARVAVSGGATNLGPASAFEDEEQREATLKYRPIAIAPGRAGGMRLAEVWRDERKWLEAPVKVDDARWGLLEHLGQAELSLERATRVAAIDYTWRLGRTLRSGA